MSYSRADYYAEWLAESFEEHGLVATKEQVMTVAADIAGWTENIGQAFYQPSDPGIGEADKLRDELRAERAKVICRQCNGHGLITSHGPAFSSAGSCWKCNGEGRHAP